MDLDAWSTRRCSTTTTSRHDVRIAVTGASGVLGRGVASRLLSQGHDVVGIARHRPESWPSAADFVIADIRDAAAVRRAVAGADVVAHCAWATIRAPTARSLEVNVGGTRNVLDAMAETGSRRIVFASSAHVYGGGEAPKTESDATAPVGADGRHKARAEEMLAASGAEWVAIRSALILGRSVDNWVRRLLALPAFPDRFGDRRMQVVHLDDALRLFVRALVDTEIDSGPVNLAAPGAPTFRQIAAALGRPVVRLGSTRGAGLVLGAPLMDTSRLGERWGFRPAWKPENVSKTSHWRCAAG